MSLVFQMVIMNFKKNLQYRENFFLMCFAVMPINMIQFVIYFLMANFFESLIGWTSVEIMFLYLLFLITYTITQVVFRQLRFMDRLIITGQMDLYFVRPIPVLQSLIFTNFNVLELFAQLIPSIFVSPFILTNMHISWNMGKILVLAGAITGGTLIQTSLFLFIGVISYFTIRSSNLDRLYFNMRTFLNYPLDIFGNGIKSFFTFVLPMGFINYYPASFILDKTTSEKYLSFLSAPIGILAISVAIFVWKKTLKYYESAGS